MRTKKELEEKLAKARNFIAIYSIVQIFFVVCYFADIMVLIWTTEKIFYFQILLTLLLTNLPIVIFSIMVGKWANEAVIELAQINNDNGSGSRQ